MRIGPRLMSVAGTLMLLSRASAQAGTNIITVQVATPPLNALRGLGLAGHADYGGFASQPAVPAGLVGPVTLTPYRTATVIT
jgi:hypothetical protein